MQAGKRSRHNAGFTYIAMVFALAMFGIGLAALGQVWGKRAQRDKEEELLVIGAAYVRAIGLYYQHSPGSQKRFPAQLAELLEDKRFVGTERYLRKLYPDPVAGSSSAWGLVEAPEGGISGIYSLSDKPALRKRATAFAGTVVKGERYVDWKFVYVPRVADSTAKAVDGK
jgi:type II secretory pathway pseudopilin PulG